MKVLHITNNFPTEKFPIFGVFVKEQIDSLLKTGIENEIFFINGREKGKTEYIKSIYRLRGFLDKNIFDIIHCHHALSALCLFLSGKSKKNRVIVSFQNDPVNELGRHIYRLIKRNSDIQIFKNNSTQISSSKSGIYLPNGVNLSYFKPISKQEACEVLQIDPNNKYLLFVSSNILRKQKRYDRFQNVLDLVNKNSNSYCVKELVLINVERRLVPYYFNAADVHLLTSDFEGSPNSVKESMACNTPVVSTNVGNVKELLTGVKGSYVCELFDETELCNLVEKALIVNNCNGRERLISFGLDSETVAYKLNNIYKSLLQ